MSVQPRTVSWNDYTPIQTEVEGIDAIDKGIKILWNEMTERRENSRGFCCYWGFCLIATGLWQLRVPLITGVAICILVSYSNR